MMKKLLFIILFSIIYVSGHTQDTEYSWDTITFEEPYAYLVQDTSLQNIWEIGAPAKTIFNSAYNGEQVILTGISQGYTENNHSHFDLIISYFNVDHFPYSVYFEFNHKYDTDAGKDGGYIEVSHDNGANWENVMEDYVSCLNPADPYRTRNLYSLEDTLFNGEPGFSGNSGGWVNTRFGWEECLVKNVSEPYDTMIIRFNFISDNEGSDKEGWMIDDIRLYSTKLSGDVENLNMRNYLVYPNPASEVLYIQSLNGERISSIQLMNLNGQLIRTALGKNFMPVQDIGEGVYILRAETAYSKFIQKIVIE